ncbi:alpha/beta hydrolase [Salinicoccus hispanicus]|uniref:Esterase family protein n=1 Tax=Salinicoccus hispanicus TaxID=157225 RepID=A0A6N8U3A7_9STAP|nr:alpha/beta hydrolase-fold protein [Salinicoccus hispanicus]MXQ50885.1 esterase family protein [Salinicoccus hispanicus]
MEMEPGKIHTINFESETLGETYEIQYYLPKNFSDLYKHEVIITFDSQDFFRYGQVERIYEKLRKNEEIERALIIGVPYPSVEWRNDYFSPNGAHHDDFVTFVARELISWVDANFPTLKVGTSRTLMGDSLAGSFAFSVAASYPATFSQALAFSPYVDDAFIERFQSQMSLMHLDLYHTIGLEEDDFITISKEQADFLTPNRKLNDYLSSEPLEYTYRELDGGHVWKSWKPELEPALKHFLG